MLQSYTPILLSNFVPPSRPSEPYPKSQSIAYKDCNGRRKGGRDFWRPIRGLFLERNGRSRLQSIGVGILLLDILDWRLFRDRTQLLPVYRKARTTEKYKIKHFSFASLHTSSSPKDDRIPAPYAFISSPCLQRPNSTVNQ